MKKQIEEMEIEEMAELICDNFADGRCATDGCACNHNCEYNARAAALYNAGYRKKKEGHWVSYPLEEKMLRAPWREGNVWYKCSVCGEDAEGWCEDTYYADPRLTNYCPNCGSKMKNS